MTGWMHGFEENRAMKGKQEAMRYRKRPVEIDAIKWDGGDYGVLDRFCGNNWGRADAKGVLWQPLPDGEEVVIFNAIDQQWLCVPKGHWIIRGVEGEIYPCDPAVFNRTYETV